MLNWRLGLLCSVVVWLDCGRVASYDNEKS
jgi:hypothetical protein